MNRQSIVGLVAAALVAGGVSVWIASRPDAPQVAPLTTAQIVAYLAAQAGRLPATGQCVDIEVALTSDDAAPDGGQTQSPWALCNLTSDAGGDPVSLVAQQCATAAQALCQDAGPSPCASNGAQACLAAVSTAGYIAYWSFEPLRRHDADGRRHADRRPLARSQLLRDRPGNRRGRLALHVRAERRRRSDCRASAHNPALGHVVRGLPRLSVRRDHGARPAGRRGLRAGGRRHLRALPVGQPVRRNPRPRALRSVHRPERRHLQLLCGLHGLPAQPSVLLAVGQLLLQRVLRRRRERPLPDTAVHVRRP